MTFFPASIDRYDDTGYGLASGCRSDGFHFTVRLFATILGEEVSFQGSVKRRKGIRDGIDIQILKSSQERVVPRCIHFGSCGGCAWQHMNLAYQRRVKEQYVFEQFRTVLAAFLEQTEFVPIDAAGLPWAYRNKMEFSFAQDRAGTRFLGLYRRFGRGVFSLQECHLGMPWMAKAVHITRRWWEEEASHLTAFCPSSGGGTLRALTLREGLSTGDRMVILTVSSKPEFAPRRSDLISFQRRIEEALFPAVSDHFPTLSIVVRIHQAIPKIPTQIYEMLLVGPGFIREILSVENSTYTFHISPQAFFQPNTLVAHALYSNALQMAAIGPEDVVYDLYCGTGTFGILAAHIAKKVVAIELSKEAAYDAKTHADRLGRTNFHIHAGDVTKVLKDLQKEHAPIVIVDPPRSGLQRGAVEAVLSLKPKRIVYVSCNPKSQVRDLHEILSTGRYRLQRVCPIDQFPQTAHVENIVCLNVN